MKKSLLILLVLPILLFSCEDALDELTSIGTFQSTLTGDVEKQFDGTAAFTHTMYTTATPQGSSLIIGLSKVSDQSEAIAITLTDLGTDGIPAGTYSYSVGGSGALFVPAYINSQETYSLPDLTKTNQVVISSVGNTQVKGTFEINLVDFVTQKAVKITGTFNALGTTEND